jgi:hypothetical protein
MACIDEGHSLLPVMREVRRATISNIPLVLPKSMLYSILGFHLVRRSKQYS